jgi:hypothetical protein
MPDRIGLEALRLAQHKRFRAAALAGGDLIHAPPGGDRAVLIQHALAIPLALKSVMPLDQKPVGAFAALAVMPQPHQYPASLQLLAGERESQLALGKRFGRIAIAGPEAAVP